MSQFTAARQTSTGKLPFFFLKFKKRARILKVNEKNPDTENTSNWDNFHFEVNSESKCDKSALLEVSLKNSDLYFHP